VFFFSIKFCCNDFKILPMIMIKGHFTLGVRTKKTQELSNPFGGEFKIGPKGFTLGVKTNVYQND
jgi:hypothetical protein